MIKEVIGKVSQVFLLTDRDSDGCLAGAIGSKVLSDTNIKFTLLPSETGTVRGVGKEELHDILVDTDEEECFLIITADQGSSDHEIYEELKEARHNAIIWVTDHHEIEDEERLLKTIDYFNNPHSATSEMNKNYSGATVLYKVLESIMTDNKPFCKALAAISNITDMMSQLDEENRQMYKESEYYFLQIPLLKAILKDSKLTVPHSRFIGMKVGAVLNTGYRSPRGGIETAIEALLGDSKAIAKIRQLNIIRKRTVNDLIDYVKPQLKASKFLLPELQLLITQPQHKTFNGLLCSRVGYDLKVPTIALSILGDTLSGSARAIQDIPLLSILKEISNESPSLGLEAKGHEAALGINVARSEDGLKNLVNSLKEKLAKHDYKELTEYDKINGDDITNTVTDISKNHPYGNFNKYPSHEISDMIIVKASKFKAMSFITFSNSKGEEYTSISFSKLKDVEVGDKVTVNCTIEVDSNVTFAVESIK